MFGLSKWEKFRKSVLNSNLLEGRARDDVLKMIKDHQITSKKELLDVLDNYLRGALPSSGYKIEGWDTVLEKFILGEKEQIKVDKDYFKDIIAVIKAKLPEF